MIRTLTYVGPKAEETAYFDRTGVIWTPGKSAAVLDEFTANEMLDYPDQWKETRDVIGLTLDPASGLTLGGQALTAGQANALREGAETLKRPTFRDTFKRADTLAGTIGAGWTAKGVYVSSYPLPAATDGKITSQAVETPSGLTTYWMRTLPQTPVQIQSVMAWEDLNNGQAGYQTFALICTASANLIDNMGIHITLAHTTLRIQERIAGGAFVDLIAAVDIQPRLSMAQGENVLTVTIDAANNSGVVYLNERAYPFSSPNLAANIGAVVAFEIFQAGGPSTRYKCRVLEFSAG